MFKELNPLLHSELRLAVVSILIGVESADFVFIRQQTGATAGNLSVQLDKLAKAGYIEVEKTFRGKIPCTVCRITDAGRDAFADYVEALQSYIKEFWRGGRVVDCGGLENRCTARYPGFESLSLR